MNPCTLGWYLPLLVKDAPGALQPSDGDRASQHPASDPEPLGGALPGQALAASSQAPAPDLPHVAVSPKTTALGPPASSSALPSTVGASSLAAQSTEAPVRRER